MKTSINPMVVSKRRRLRAVRAASSVLLPAIWNGDCCHSLSTTAPPHAANAADQKKANPGNVNFEDWITDQPKQVKDWTELTRVDGTIPDYVKGTWIRNGGGAWSKGKDDDTFSHIFDGMAKISAYRFDGNKKVYHQARFLEGKWHKKYVQGQTLPPSIGTGPILDEHDKPKLGWWRTVKAIWNVVTAFDNTPVNIWDYDPLNQQGKDKSVTALTDAPPRTTVDYSSMDTQGSTTLNRFAKDAKGYELLTTAHPLYSLNTDDTYNVAVELGLGVNVNLILESSSGDRTVVGSFPVTDGIPYFHSFGLSRNCAVIVVQPLRLNLDIPQMLEKGFLRSMQRVDYTRVVVMDLHNSDILLDQKLDDPLYFYHGISTAEELDENTGKPERLSFRICAYKTPGQLTGKYQFLRLEQARKGKKWRNKLDRGGKFCDVVCDLKEQSVAFDWNEVSPIKQGFELPVTRYSRAHGGAKHGDTPIDEHPRYVYSFGAYALGAKEYDDWGLFKFNTKTMEIANYFQEDSVYVSEPAFVADPNGTNEDDGVLLCQAYFGVEQETKLLVLDARTMRVMATVNTNMRTPMDFHGGWIPNIGIN